MERIDAHIHYAADHPDCVRLLERLELKLLNVCVASDSQGRWRSHAELFQRLAEQAPDRFAWCTTFDPPCFDDTDYVDRVIESLSKDIEAGAIACKIWKNVGMEIRKPSGEFLMPDDSLLNPIYEYLAASDITLLAHIGEPLACWQPLTEDSPHHDYYRQHPEWHMYGKPDFPSHQDIIEARDRMLAKHPNLRVIGAHLGSLEYDVAEIARRLDRYPNFAVGTSARLLDLAYQNPQVVRQFFIDYQNRILFGTDFVQRQPASAMPEAERGKSLERIEERYCRDFAYFESDQTWMIRDREVQGLGLPEDVLEKFYFRNACAWYTGLIGARSR